MYIYICTYTYTRTHINIHMYICLCVHIYMYTQILEEGTYRDSIGDNRQIFLKMNADYGNVDSH